MPEYFIFILDISFDSMVVEMFINSAKNTVIDLLYMLIMAFRKYTLVVSDVDSNW